MPERAKIRRQEPELPADVRTAWEHEMAERIRLLGLQFDVNQTARIRSIFMGLADHLDPHMPDD